MGIPKKGPFRLWADNRPVGPGWAAPRQIFIHSALDSTPAAAGLEKYRWHDPAVPNLVGADTILAEIPPEGETSADLLKEIQFAGEAGSQVIWLITARSNVHILETLLGVTPFTLRQDGSRDSLTVTDPRFVGYFATLDAYRIVFPLPERFDKVATVNGSPVATAVIRQDDSSCACVAFLPFPVVASEANVSSLLAVLSRMRAAAGAAHGLWRALGMGVTVCAIFVGIIINLQVSYLSLNRWIDKISDPDLKIVTPLKSAPDGFILTQLRDLDEGNKNADFHSVLSLTPRQVIGRANLDSLLELYTSLGFERLEQPTIDLLQEQQHRATPTSRMEEADRHLAGYASSLDRALRFDLKNNEYQSARLQAHKLLAIVYSLRDPSAKAYQLLALRRAHSVINSVKDRYIYHDGEFVEFFVAGDNDYRNDHRPGDPGDPSLQDEAGYFHCTAETRKLAWPQESDCWRGFLASYPHSPLLPEADFNIVHSHFYGALRVRTTSPSEVTQALRDCDEFVLHYPDSYLADDVMLYGLELASFVDNDQDLWKRYLILASHGGEGSDSYDRLLVKLSSKMLDPDSTSVGALQSLLRISGREPDRSIDWFAGTQLGKEQHERLPNLMTFLSGIPRTEGLTLRQATLGVLKVGLKRWAKEIDEIESPRGGG